MAACGSLSSLFEKPMPENPTLIDSLSSRNQIMPNEPVDNSCFTEIFGEIHFQETPAPPPATAADRAPSFDLSDLDQNCTGGHGDKSSLDSLLGLDKKQDACDSSSSSSNRGFPPKKSDKLQLCTERLGSESSDGVDDLMKDGGDEWSGGHRKEKIDAERLNSDGGHPRNCSGARTEPGGFPPPISSIGRSGKSWSYFRSFRQNGRFVLREVRIPTQDLLHASREDGRLKLQLLHPDEDEDDQEQDDDDEEEEEEQEEKGQQL
ncbi:unnamed protein product [Musa acuminata subsp. malaccensis]|uniref:(wild Malaysian banana) hypothetical protein n=1 Tax=Musa acuminata subsp. malaccensis TaxID=214687 RepID=A0A804K8D3_MUSAM|nr:PREDICTED: protein FAF-like, chloroplastic [Musa acuminata subsp. malaccensis]CAG1832097.1 unnamed protein product [Musa acuminata subsp. malaccensis]